VSEQSSCTRSARRQPGPAYYEMAVTRDLEVRPFIVSLDPNSPRLATDGVDFPFTVAASDPELFRLSPTVTQHEVSWRLELDWTCAGRHGQVIIDDNGRPFELHPPEHPPHNGHDLGFHGTREG
jgi:hypothetical protein